MGNFASKMTRISLRPTNRGIIDFGELYYVEQTDLKEKKNNKKRRKKKKHDINKKKNEVVKSSKNFKKNKYYDKKNQKTNSILTLSIDTIKALNE